MLNVPDVFLFDAFAKKKPQKRQVENHVRSLSSNPVVGGFNKIIGDNFLCGLVAISCISCAKIGLMS